MTLCYRTHTTKRIEIKCKSIRIKPEQVKEEIIDDN